MTTGIPTEKKKRRESLRNIPKARREIIDHLQRLADDQEISAAAREIVGSIVKYAEAKGPYHETVIERTLRKHLP